MHNCILYGLYEHIWFNDVLSFLFVSLEGLCTLTSQFIGANFRTECDNMNAQIY